MKYLLCRLRAGDAYHAMAAASCCLPDVVASIKISSHLCVALSIAPSVSQFKTVSPELIVSLEGLCWACAEVCQSY